MGDTTGTIGSIEFESSGNEDFDEDDSNVEQQTFNWGSLDDESIDIIIDGSSKASVNYLSLYNLSYKADNLSDCMLTVDEIEVVTLKSHATLLADNLSGEIQVAVTCTGVSGESVVASRSLTIEYSDEQRCYLQGASYVFRGGSCLPLDGSQESLAALSCKDIAEKGFSNVSGVFWLKYPQEDTEDTFQGYCDLSTDGGGWLLVLNYERAFGTRPLVKSNLASPPFMGQLEPDPNVDGSKDSDGAASKSWGHVNNDLFKKLRGDATEVRFYCTTSVHTDAIHFKASNESIFSYFSTGVGRINGNIVSDHTDLDQHTAYLPQQAEPSYFASDQGDFAMLTNPFRNRFTDGRSQFWKIGGSHPNDWRCGFAGSYWGENHSSVHRIFIR